MGSLQGKVFRMLAVGVVLGLGGCQTQRAMQEAEATFASGDMEHALEQSQALLAKDPQNVHLRMSYLTMREKAVNELLADAVAPALSDKSAERARVLRRVLAIEPDNSRALAGLAGIERDSRIARNLLDAQFAYDTKEYATAQAKAESVLIEDPDNARARDMLAAIQEKTRSDSPERKLAAALAKPVSLQFKDIQLHQAFDVLSQTAGINFVLDKDIKSDQKTTLSLKDVPVSSALNTLLVINQLGYRALDQGTILVYPSTPAKEKDYESLRVRAFILSNADPEQVASDLKTLLRAKDVTVDKAQNMILMRDTAEAVRLAEKIVALRDLQTPEVMLEVAILEVNKSRLSELGIKYPQQAAFAPLSRTTGQPVTVNDLLNLDTRHVSATVPPLTVLAKGEDDDIKLLANPRIRVKNRESAKILIGNRVPNITSTSTSTGFVSENVQYLDVGLKLEVSPVITVDNEVAIKVALEVSNISSQITTPSGTTAYQIGTRTASTVLRLRDGENQILAGLINNESHRGVMKIPLLGDIPLLGWLFSSHSRGKDETEIVLSITPRLIRNLARPTALEMEFDSGTEASFRRTELGSVSGAKPALAPSATVAGQSASAASDARSPGVVTTASPDASVGTSVMRWSGDAQQRQGATFQQQLMLSTPAPLGGISYVVNYDPAVLVALRVSEGDLLRQGGGQSGFNQRIDAATGQIFISQVRQPQEGRGAQPGATGQATLATLTFKAVASSPGTSLKVVSITPAGVGETPVSVQAPAPQVLVVSP